MEKISKFQNSDTGNVACFTFGELFLTNSCRQAEYQVLRVDWLNIIGQSHVEYNLISQSQHMTKKSAYFNFFRFDCFVKFLIKPTKIPFNLFAIKIEFIIDYHSWNMRYLLMINKAGESR